MVTIKNREKQSLPKREKKPLKQIELDAKEAAIRLYFGQLLEILADVTNGLN